MLDKVAPLTPNEIVNLRKQIDQRKDAFTENITGRPPARPTSTQTTIDLSPGGTPPMLRVSMRQGATIMFVDAAGRPWPVEAADNFNDAGYAVSQMAEHVFSVGMKQPQIGNIAFKLKDIARPVTVTVMPAQDSTDYNLDLVVPKFVGGVPPTAMASAAPAPSHMSDELMAYLYRTPPREARRLTIGGSGTDEIMAWQISPTSMAVRTSAQILSPAWMRRQGSSDGVFVYQLPITPVVVISQGGELRNVALGGISVEPAGSNATSVSGAMLSSARLQGSIK
ncbi:DotH/IcmK family type IV secretion protein [Variovorax sp. LjRoot175]|uniref:DotH/IcmK family type IV secretion protein n=1 Tax=Variovorax sp. LjRoot175 TaxID=3342276 RepID=UPI003ECCAF5C